MQIQFSYVKIGLVKVRRTILARVHRYGQNMTRILFTFIYGA